MIPWSTILKPPLLMMAYFELLGFPWGVVLLLTIHALWMSLGSLPKFHFLWFQFDVLLFAAPRKNLSLQLVSPFLPLNHLPLLQKSRYHLWVSGLISFEIVWMPGKELTEGIALYLCSRNAKCQFVWVNFIGQKPLMRLQPVNIHSWEILLGYQQP